jgi:short-subunit dehydrogenase
MSKTIAIVGAGPGVGLSVAEKFGAEGFKVALLSRNKAKNSGLAQRLAAKGIEAIAVHADIHKAGE